jgi:uncharacterized lipoprotein YmbA|tara:strand:- start:55 stop:375 length:321 start_codon:yes stop_codon:yes gene_type:complete
MKYAKLKSNGRIVSSETGDAATDNADALTVFAAGVYAGASNINVGYEDDAVVEGWWKAQNEADKTYADKRKAEYPQIGDQLDDIYHNGIDGWKATIKTTKDKYPKP